MSDWDVAKTTTRKKKKRVASKQEKRKKRRLDDSRKKASAFDVEFKYKYSLPPPVGTPKLLEVPLPPDYLTRFMGAELETQRHWSLHPEGGLLVPIDLWDPTTYKPKTEEKPRDDEDSELLALLYQRNRNSNEFMDGKLSKMHYDSMNKVSWTLNPEMLSGSTRVKKGQTGRNLEVREVDTKFANEKILKRIEANQKKLLSVEAIEESFKSIEDLKHPRKPDLTVKESLPIFPDDRLLKNMYHHVSFDRAPLKEVAKLPFLQEASSQDCRDAAAEGCIKVSNHKRGAFTYKWCSLYTPDLSKSTELDLHNEWTSEYSRKFQGDADFGHFLVQVDNEVFWGRVQHRTKLRRKETENIDSKNDKTMSAPDRDTFASLPRFLNLDVVIDEEEEELEEEMEIPE